MQQHESKLNKHRYKHRPYKTIGDIMKALRARSPREFDRANHRAGVARKLPKGIRPPLLSR